MHHRRKWINGRASGTKADIARAVAECLTAPGNWGINVGMTLDSEDEALTELVKVYVFINSQQKLFAKTVRVSKNRTQILADVVESEHPKSRNYLARRASDAATIPVEIVHMATSFAITVNTGALNPEGVWHPVCPIPGFFEDQHIIRMFQLLSCIFTHERVFPLVEQQTIRAQPFDVHAGALFFALMYEHYLLLKTFA